MTTLLFLLAVILIAPSAFAMGICYGLDFHRAPLPVARASWSQRRRLRRNRLEVAASLTRRRR